MARRNDPIIPEAILDQLLAGADAKTAFDSNGLLDQLKKALAERALNAEMDHHLGGNGAAGNMRNGYSKKTVLTDSGSLDLSIPVIGSRASIRSFWRSTSADFLASTRRSSRCTRAA